MISMFIRRPSIAAKAAGAASIVAQNMFTHFLEKANKDNPKKPFNESKSNNNNQRDLEQNKSPYSKPTR